MSTHRRIAKNTVILYARMLLTAGVSLYTVRVVLDALGVEDYGLYNVVAGTVALLAFLPNSMASATQRYFSYALGEGDKNKLRTIFSVNWLVYAALAAFALLVLESVGAWFISEYVKIASERYEAALVLYRTSAWTFILSIAASPFQAVITAHEDMHIYAALSVFEVLLKLAAAFVLTVAPMDKLEVYGYLMLSVAVLSAIGHAWICFCRYDECQFLRFYWDSKLLREVVGFTGWTLFGQLSTVFRNQAVTILMNQVFGPVVVAARAIALSVATQTNLFAINFNTSLYSPIVKYYAKGDRAGMYELVFNGSKITFFLMWILALPIFLQMPFILGIWLKTPPPDVILFARLALIESLISAFSLPLMTAARAPGKMRAYELSLGSIQIAIFLVSWLVLRAGGAPASVFIVATIASAIMLALRLAIVRRLTGISGRAFVRRVLMPTVVVITLSLVPASLVAQILPAGIVPGTISIGVSFGFALGAIYLVGLEPEWRLKARALVADRYSRIFIRA